MYIDPFPKGGTCYSSGAHIDVTGRQVSMHHVSILLHDLLDGIDKERPRHWQHGHTQRPLFHSLRIGIRAKQNDTTLM